MFAWLEKSNNRRILLQETPFVKKKNMLTLVTVNGTAELYTFFSLTLAEVFHFSSTKKLT